MKKRVYNYVERSTKKNESIKNIHGENGTKNEK